ncbi:ORF6N domain-containing protein [Mucilaginibacter pocheonensis]
MLDFAAAALYEVDMKTLRRSIKRNHRRFPSDFLYILKAFLKCWAIKHTNNVALCQNTGYEG